MKTVEELKEARVFIVEEWVEMRRSNGVSSIDDTSVKTHEYVFEYFEEEGEEKLLVGENLPDAETYQIVNAINVLADVAKEERVLWAHIIPLNGISFNLYNPRIRFLRQTL